MKLNSRLIACTTGAALGGLLFEFDIAMIAGAIHGISLHYQLTPAALRATVSCAAWGTVLRRSLSAIPDGRFGARACPRFGVVLYFIAI